MPVHVIFQKIGESEEELVNREKFENHDPEAIFIVVKFVSTMENSLTL